MTQEPDEEGFESRLGKQIAAYHDAGLLHAAIVLGLPERMEKRALSADALAAELGLSAPHLNRLLRGLAGLGICAEGRDGRFALSPQGRSLLPGARLRQKVQIVVAQYWRPWANLAASVTTAKPAFEQVFGQNVADWRRDHVEAGALFDSYLAHEALAIAPAVTAVLDLAGVESVADLGAGYGGLLAGLLQTKQNLRGILFDRPHLIEAALPFLQAQGVADRVERIGGDLLAAIPVEADLYVLNGVLRQWDDANARAILANCRKAMRRGTRLVIIERLLPERAADDPAAIMLDLHMMAITGGRVRGLAEFEAMLSQAGFGRAKAPPTASGLTVIEAVPA
jgi:SAM-dependent methyltransferase/AraC-like DNA-binding protein